MVDRLNETPVNVLLLAQDEARSLGDERLGTEHILLGLLSFDNAACCALSGFGVSYDDVRLEIEEVRSKQNALSLDADVVFSERTQRCLELAYMEAFNLKHHRVAPEHLLMAMLRLGNGVAIGILSKMGVSMVDLEVALLYQCSSALAAPQEDVGAELLTQIEVWNRLATIAKQQGYEELAQSAGKHTRMYCDALMELEASSRANVQESTDDKQTKVEGGSPASEAVPSKTED